MARHCNSSRTKGKQELTDVLLGRDLGALAPSPPATTFHTEMAGEGGPNSPLWSNKGQQIRSQTSCVRWAAVSEAWGRSFRLKEQFEQLQVEPGALSSK